MGDSEVVLSTSDITFLDHKSCICELESDLASCMRREFCMRQHLSVLEKGKAKAGPRSLDSDDPFHGVEHCHKAIPGERGTPYPCLSQCLQMAHRSSGPPHEANHEYWAGDGSKGCPMKLIPIDDVVVSPPLASSSSENGKYHEAPVEDRGIAEVSDWELDLVGRKRNLD